jgi:hypothetical protein
VRSATGDEVAVSGPRPRALLVLLLLDALPRQHRLADAELLDKVPASDDFYLDALAKVEMDHDAKGRIVLLGDATYGNTLGGFGTGLATDIELKDYSTQ